jgi:hypothetical protein
LPQIASRSIGTKASITYANIALANQANLTLTSGVFDPRWGVGDKVVISGQTGYIKAIASPSTLVLHESLALTSGTGYSCTISRAYATLAAWQAGVVINSGAPTVYRKLTGVHFRKVFEVLQGLDVFNNGWEKPVQPTIPAYGDVTSKEEPDGYYLVCEAEKAEF